MAEKVQVWKIERGEFPGNFLAVDESGLDAITDEIRHAEEGDVFMITVQDWEKKDLDGLPEWDGW